MYKISLNRTPDYKERIKVIIRQADPYDKTGDATKGGGGGLQNLTSPK